MSLQTSGQDIGTSTVTHCLTWLIHYTNLGFCWVTFTNIFILVRKTKWLRVWSFIVSVTYVVIGLFAWPLRYCFNIELKMQLNENFVNIIDMANRSKAKIKSVSVLKEQNWMGQNDRLKGLLWYNWTVEWVTTVKLTIQN